MISILFQIIGSFYLVFAIVKKRLPRIIQSSSLNASDKNKIDNIKNIYFETWLNRFGFSYLFIGLVLSIKKISESSLFTYIDSNIALCTIIVLFLLVLGFSVSAIIVRWNAKIVENIAKQRSDGDIWIEQ